ncbi:retrovirus-related pol polyprotein from transposon TNT 1-94 [Tanacetum coccineum]
MYPPTHPSQTQINHSSVPPSHPYQSQMIHQTLSLPQIAYNSPQPSTQPLTEFPQMDSGLAVPVFNQEDDLIACLNKAMDFLTAVASLRFPSTNNQLRTSSNPRNQATVQDGRVIVQQVQGRQRQSYAGNSYKGNATSLEGNNTGGQARVTEDLDAYDSNCDDVSNAKAVLMANLSNYGSDVILEVPPQTDMDNQSVHAMQGFEQTPVADLKGYQNPFYLKKAQRIKPTLYDGSVISSQRVTSPVINDEETLILEEVSRSKMLAKQNDPISKEKKVNTTPINYVELNRLSEDFGKRFVPQQELSDEQAFWLQTSHPNTDQSASYPVKIEAPRELLKFSLMEVVVQQYFVDKQCFDIQKKVFFLENDRLLQKIMSQDVMICVMNSTAVCDDVNVAIQCSESCVKCLNLDAELLNKQKYFENNDLKAQLQAKDTTICKLKEHIKSMRENDKEEKVKHEMDKIETINIELEHKHGDSLIAQLNFKSLENVDLKCQIQDKLDLDPLAPRLLENREARIYYLKHTQEQADELLVYVSDTCPNAIKLSAIKVAVTPMNKVKKVRSKPTNNKKNDKISQPQSSNRKNKVEAQHRKVNLNSNKKNHVVEPICDADVKHSLLNANSELVCATCNQCCPDCSLVSGLRMFKTYHREPLSAHELWYSMSRGLDTTFFSVGQFCDADLEVAFQKNTCFIRNLDGVDLLSGFRDTNLYTISLDDMLKMSPICLLSKALKTKSWLWHRRLSHLNFACALGKSKKSSHQPKAEDTNQEKLYLLFLRSKDEARDAIIKCIKNIQVRLNATFRNVRTDNGTEFVNQTLRDFYENVGISHQTSVGPLFNRTTLSKGETKLLWKLLHNVDIFKSSSVSMGRSNQHSLLYPKSFLDRSPLQQNSL